MTTVADVLVDLITDIESLLDRGDLDPASYADEKAELVDQYEVKVKAAVEKERKRNGR